MKNKDLDDIEKASIICALLEDKKLLKFYLDKDKTFAVQYLKSDSDDKRFIAKHILEN